MRAKRRDVPRPFRSQSRNCQLPVAKVLKRQSLYRALVGDLVNVTVIDSIPAFCPDGSCQMVKDGSLLYADADHLSAAGSRFQARTLLAPIFA